MFKKKVVEIEVTAEPQPEGGFTITCPTLPGLITEGPTLDEALSNVPDALEALLELYEEDGLPLPDEIFVVEEEETGKPVTVRTTASVSV